MAVDAPTGTILVVDDNPMNIQVLFDMLNEIWLSSGDR